MLSPEQKILVEVYGDGDYSYFTDPCEAEGAYDTLFLFLMRELAPDGDTDREEYIRRMERAIDDIQGVLGALSE